MLTPIHSVTHIEQGTRKMKVITADQVRALQRARNKRIRRFFKREIERQLLEVGA